MAAQDQSVFQDILSLEIDTTKFDADLSRITAAWDAAMAKMEAAGEQVGPTINIGGDIDALTVQLKQLTGAVGDSFQALSTTLVDTMGRAEAAVEKVTVASEELEAQGTRTGSSFGNSMGYAVARMGAMEAGAGRIGYGLGLLTRMSSTLSEAFGVLFAPMLVLAFADVITTLADKFTKVGDEVRKANTEWDSFAGEATTKTDEMQVKVLKLADEVAKLQGRPEQNHLAEAILEAKMASDELSKSLEQSLEKANELMQQYSVSFFQSLVSGKARTGSVIDTGEMKDANAALADVVQQAQVQYDKASQMELEAATTHDKAKIAEAHKTADEMRKVAQQEVQDQADKVKGLINTYRQSIEAHKQNDANMLDLTTADSYTNQGKATDANAFTSKYANQTRELGALQTNLDSVTTRYKLLNQEIDLTEQKGALEPKGTEKTDLTKFRGDFKAALDDLKTGAENARASIKQQMDASKMTVKDAETAIIASYKAEEDQIKALVNAYLQRAKAMHLSPQQMAQVSASMQETLASFHKTEQAEEQKAQDAVIKDQQARIKQELQYESQERNKQRQIDLASVKSGVQEGLVSQVDAVKSELEVEKQAHQEKMDMLQQELSKVAPGTKEYDNIEHQMAMERLDYKQRELELDHQLYMAKEQQIQQEEHSLQLTKDRYAAQQQEAATVAQSSGATPYTVYGLQTSSLQAQSDAKFQAVINAFDDFQRKLHDADNQWTPAVQKLFESYQKAVDSFDDANDKLQVHLNESKWSNGMTGWDGLYSTINKVTQVFNTLEGSVKNVISAYQQGGAFGAAGAGASALGGIFEQAGKEGTGMNSLFSSLGIGGSFLGPVGAGLGLVGSVFGAISGIFTAAARHISEQISKTFQTIMQEYQSGNLTLIDTIHELQQERQNAINQLSGKKGGQDQLNKLLPQFDQEIAQLQRQQQQVIENFQEQTEYLRDGTEIGAQWVQTWVGALKQIKEFIGAGGDPKLAQEFLTLKEKQMKSDMQSQYNDAEQQAVQDALALNDLLKQRQSIMDQINQINVRDQGSVERRVAGAILANQAANSQKKQLQDQLDQINQQLDLQQKKVSKEQAIFGISTDIASLHRLDEKLQLAALDDQLAKVVQMQAILKQMAHMPTPVFNGNLSNPSFFGGTQIPGWGATQYNIHVTTPAHPNPYTYGQNAASSIQRALLYQRRAGMFQR